MLETLCRLCVLAAVAMLLVGCTKDGETLWIDDAAVEDDRDAVVFVYGENQLGDITYNDEIYSGVVAATKRHDLLLTLERLDSAENLSLGDAMDIFLWVQNLELDDSRTLIVWCNDSYEPLLREREDLLTENPKVTHLLVESRDASLPVNTMYFSLYGAAYQAAMTVNDAMGDVESVALVGDGPKDAVLGFLQGVSDGTRAINVTHFALPKGEDYILADSAYRLAYQIDNGYQMAMPMNADVAQGLLRYNREYAVSFYTLGINTDMRPYSSRIPLSMTKSLATAVEEWIGNWAEGREQDKHIVYDLESGYCGLTVSEDYKSLLSNMVEQHRSAAITKEKAYLAQ
ncbi:MAG: hypothetical protein LIP02_08515 [Bacteroidales bacterium]|nr:hypothetical protein [Bacteroidales bacterium]